LQGDLKDSIDTYLKVQIVDYFPIPYCQKFHFQTVKIFPFQTVKSNFKFNLILGDQSG
jgi:hypothetical protein